MVVFVSALDMLDHDLSTLSCSPICYTAWVRRQADVSCPLEVEIVVDLVVVVSGGFRVCVLEEFSGSFPFYLLLICTLALTSRTKSVSIGGEL